MAEIINYRPIRTNKLKQAIAANRRTSGFVMNVASVEVIEILGVMGFDWAWIEGEHGAFDLETIENLCRVCELVGVTPIARVPDSSPARIGQFLDRGVQGVLVPHVSTPEQAETVAKACFYGPKGTRSYGAARDDGYHFGIEDWQGYLAARNAEVSMGVLIEDAEAVRNIEAIIEVEEIDYFAIGPFDLAQSMGFPGNPGHAAVQEAITTIETAVHRAGKMMQDDILTGAYVSELLLAGAQRLLGQSKNGARGILLGPLLAT